MKTIREVDRDLGITTAIVITWLVILSLCVTNNYLKQQNYQEECVQSHVEIDYKIKVWYFENGTYNGKTIDTDFIKITAIDNNFIGDYGNKTVCDKYALVRYTNEVKE